MMRTFFMEIFSRGLHLRFCQVLVMKPSVIILGGSKL